MEVEKGNAVVVTRDYRKGNWTVEETMVLIEAKKLDEERRSNITNITIKPSTQLRWKWIEEYCWKKACFRSQNQCNDKWDNLMRDFKKVREFETTTRRTTRNNGSSSDSTSSYWKMDKMERKNHSLPSNLLPQIYQALAHVVEAKLGISVVPTSTMVFRTCSNTTTGSPSPLPPPPPPPPPPPRGRGGGGDRLPLPTQGKRRSSEEGSGLIEAIKGYEEREETRHKELYIMHQKRYKIEESNIEMERQGFNGLVDAINNLSNTILAFTSQRTPL